MRKNAIIYSLATLLLLTAFIYATSYSIIPMQVGPSTTTISTSHHVNLTMSNTYNFVNATKPAAGVWPYTIGSLVKISAVNCYGTGSAARCFKNWTGTGPGSYTGKNLNETIIMNNSIKETANYVPEAPNTTTIKTTTTSKLTTTITIKVPVTTIKPMPPVISPELEVVNADSTFYFVFALVVIVIIVILVGTMMVRKPEDTRRKK
jgi:hypothetical protein